MKKLLSFYYMMSFVLLQSFGQSSDDLYPIVRRYEEGDRAPAEIQLGDDKIHLHGNLEGVYYQHVFDTPVDSADLVKILTDKFGSLRFNAERYVVDYQSLGYGYMGLPFYISRSNLFFDVIIEVKENRYRITASNIRYSDSQTISLWGVSSSDVAVNRVEEQIFNKRGELRAYSGNIDGLRCLSESFDQYFDVQKFSKITKSDW